MYKKFEQKISSFIRKLKSSFISSFHLKPMYTSYNFLTLSHPFTSLVRFRHHRNSFWRHKVWGQWPSELVWSQFRVLVRCGGGRICHHTWSSWWQYPSVRICQICLYDGDTSLPFLGSQSLSQHLLLAHQYLKNVEITVNVIESWKIFKWSKGQTKLSLN